MEVAIGKVNHYFNRLGVAALDLSDTLRFGDVICIRGHTTDCAQLVSSMEIHHYKVLSVGPGADVAVRVLEPVRAGDVVYRLTGEDAEGVRDSFNGSYH